MKDQIVDQKYLAQLSKKVMYFWNDEDECFVKSIPGVGYFVKFKDIAEYQVNGESDLVIKGVMSGEVATMAEYEKY